MNHEINLTGYTATCGETNNMLDLGTAGSYGLEKLHVTADAAWNGLTITATFTNSGSTTVPVTDGAVDVPPEATRLPTRDRMRYGMLAFKGVDAQGKLRIISTPIDYRVQDSAETDGSNTINPTPDQYAQFVAEVMAEADRAEAAANRAEAAGSTVSPEQIAAAVNNYLNENPVQATPIDATLTQSGQAADAKAVGDALGNLSEEKVTLPKDTGGNVIHGTAGWYAVSDGAGGITWVEAGNTGGSPGGSGSGESGGNEPETVQLPFLGYTQDAFGTSYAYSEWIEKILPTVLQYAWFCGEIDGAGTFNVRWPEDAFELIDKNDTAVTTGFPKGMIALFDADGSFLSGLVSDGTNFFENGVWSETSFSYLNMKGESSFSVAIGNTDAKYLIFTMRRSGTLPDGYDDNNAGFAKWASENVSVTFTGVVATVAEESAAQAVDADYQQNYEVSTLSLTSSAQTDTTTFEGVLEQAKNAWMLEYGGNVNKIPVVVHTDQHGWLAKGQIIGDVFDTISSMVNWYDISKVINLGDTANSYDSPEDLTAGSPTLENYLNAMSEVPYSKRIEIFGNHDLAYFVDGTLTFIDSEQFYLQPYFRNIFARKTSNNGYFVVKDDNFNIKYVVISGFEVDKGIGNGNGFIMSSKQIAWMIDELEKADGYDVIILSHVPLWKSATMINPIDGSTETNSGSVDAAINMDALYAARKNKTSGTITDRYGVEHSYDFGNSDGELLCSLHGHFHADGCAYTGGVLLSATFQNFYSNPRCLYFILIDRENRQLNVWKVDSTPQFQNYQIPLDKPAE